MRPMPPPLPSAERLGLAFRPMTDGDLPFVAELFASTRAELFAALPPAMWEGLVAQQHEAQHRHYRAAWPDAEWLIVERGGEAIGRLYLDSSGDAFHLIDISLVPAARGAGFGGAILADVIAAARQSGRRVTINVERNNPALRLYERLGFAPIGEFGVYLQLEWKAEPASGQ